MPTEYEIKRDALFISAMLYGRKGYYARDVIKFADVFEGELRKAAEVESSAAASKASTGPR